MAKSSKTPSKSLAKKPRRSTKPKTVPSTAGKVVGKEVTAELLEHYDEHKATVIAVSSAFAGPIPPAKELEKYEKIMAGSANRFMVWVEDQADHRRSLERKDTKAIITQEGRAQIFAFVLGLCAIGSAVVVSLYGYPWAAGAIVVPTFGAVGAIGILQSRRRQRDRGPQPQEDSV